tara:strand:+ start:318 stop:2042 length:1725 start_codon:yes stop_codon:yes gene_type:complete
MSITKENTGKMPQLADFTIERAAEAIFWVDSKARFQRANDAACRTLGYSRDELLSMTVFDVDSNYQKNVWPEFWEKIKKDKAFTVESCFRAKDGRKFPVEITINFIEFEGKEYTCTFVHDITEREQAKEKIESLAKFPDENPNPVLRIATEGKVIYSNEGSHPLLKAWDCQRDKTLHGKWRSFNSDIFNSGHSKEIEVTCGDKIFLVLFSPIVDSGYVCVYGRDITERKKAEEALRIALSEVEQLKNRLQAENIYLQDEIKIQHNFDEILSNSKKIKTVLQKVEQVASTGATVLVLGETGTGKELLARAVHNVSPRKNRPLVKVNCAALPASLIESELFGHEKGAFTGAISRKIGRFELADGGTIFLDEIGDLPLELQAKLLRILQDGEFERLGNPRTMKANVRVIAATNRDLETFVQDRKFREDLYYRLNVFPIKIPPLRERKEDIPLLVKYFIMKYGSKIGKRIEKISEKVMDRLQAYQWPGNVRELENIIERAVIVSQGKQLELGDWVPKTGEVQGKQLETLEEIEREHIRDILGTTCWRVSGKKGAAKILGLKPTTLESRMKKLNIKRGG